MMEYKGYTAKVEFDDEAGLFHGQVINMRDVITFQGESVEELRREFAASVEDYLEFCTERGEKPEKPFSGQFLVRIKPELHRDIAIAATQANQSVNAWVTATLQRAVEVRRGVGVPPPGDQEFLQQVSSVYHAVFNANQSSPLLEHEVGHTMPRLTGQPTQSLRARISASRRNILSSLDLESVGEEED